VSVPNIVTLAGDSQTPKWYKVNVALSTIEGGYRWPNFSASVFVSFCTSGAVNHHAVSPGSELAGIVEAVGVNVAGLGVGDKVCASALTGAYAEKQVLPADSLVLLPDDMDLAEGAVFRVSFATAYYALVQRAGLRRAIRWRRSIRRCVRQKVGTRDVLYSTSDRT
jgi:hypothetical protein